MFPKFAAEKPKKVQNVFSGKFADGQKEEGAKIGKQRVFPESFADGQKEEGAKIGKQRGGGG